MKRTKEEMKLLKAHVMDRSDQVVEPERRIALGFGRRHARNVVRLEAEIHRNAVGGLPREASDLRGIVGPLLRGEDAADAFGERGVRGKADRREALRERGLHHRPRRVLSVAPDGMHVEIRLHSKAPAMTASVPTGARSTTGFISNARKRHSLSSLPFSSSEENS